jgi:pseudouridine-5'-phosphate glycosidase
MPYPKNVETALAVEQIVRDNGATPATIAIIKGKLKVGLTGKKSNTSVPATMSSRPAAATSFIWPKAWTEPQPSLPP